MSSWTAEIRRRAAEERRSQQIERKRQRELERSSKEIAKLSALEEARLEVEVYENTWEVLLSVHKEQCAPIDWVLFAVALPPAPPLQPRRHAFAAALKHGRAPLTNATLHDKTFIEIASQIDDEAEQIEDEEYARQLAEWDRMRVLARRVLSGDPEGYTEAVSEFSALGEIEALGSLPRMTVISSKLVECDLLVNGRATLPQEVKSLGATGKLSVKPMPKSRFQELYQDYVCSCVLRVGREIMALLPVSDVQVNITVNEIDARTGRLAQLPVLSVALDRDTLEKLDFERLDPSDSMENFQHRGDLKVSRKSGEFVPIQLMKVADSNVERSMPSDITGLLAKIRGLRAGFSTRIKGGEDIAPTSKLNIS